jgi:phenylalanyl-tRNA synthetase beta chain
MTGEVIRGMVPAEESRIDRIKALLVGLGCHECVTYSFGAVSELDKLNLDEDDKLRRAVRIINPLGDEQGYMRTTPVPDMLKVVANNINKKVQDIRLFESGRVYLPTGDSKELPEERKYICIALCGDEDFFSLKGIIENILESFGINDARFVPEGALYYHPGRRASVYSGGQVLGQMGEIHPDVAQNYGISKRVYIAEMCVHAICGAADDTKKYEPLPKYPAAERDLALIVDNDVLAADLVSCIKDNAGPHFESVALFDVYTGGQVGEGKKSLAFSIVFRAKDRTLRDEEANEARDAIALAAEKKYGAKMRE